MRKKHIAKQLVLLKKNNKKAIAGTVERRNLGGRPKSGRTSMVVWLDESYEVALRAHAERQGVTPGIAVEMMMTILCDLDLMQVACNGK